jgi:hypothetical protein
MKSMKRAAMKLILSLILGTTLLTACTSPQPPVPTSTNALPPAPSATQTQTASPTLTLTPSPVPSLTPTFTHLPPTDTPFPTLEQSATPIPFDPSVKQILIEYGIFGGDGGSDTDIYYGRAMPNFVLYTDGQLILKTPNDLLQKALSSNEVCTLLSNIKATGFFEVAEGDTSDWMETHKPIYQSVSATPDVGEGGIYEDILVNGESHRQVEIYYALKDYLIEPVQRVYDLITNYRPDGLVPYRPKQVALWIEPIFPSGRTSDTPTPTPQTWPTTLPALTSLVAPSDRGPAQLNGANALQVQKLFKQLPGDGVFIDQGRPYLVIARPLLPNETFDSFPLNETYSVSVDLPFNCAG